MSEVDPIHGVDPELDGSHHIDGASPAAGAGVEYLGLTGDMDGVCYGSPPSLGAYEALSE